MTLDSPEIKDAATFFVFALAQAYNMWKQSQARRSIADVREVVAANYATLQDDINAAHAAIERAAVTIAGGDRRRPSSTLSSSDAAAAQKAGFGQRWTDPRTPRPDGST